MKLMFISDIHGSSLYAQKAIDTYKQEKADKLIILGDIFIVMILINLFCKV